MTDTDECRSWSYYHAKVAPLFAGALDEPLWSRLIPQLAASYAGIRYAIFAVSGYYEHRQQTTIHHTSTPTERYVQALQWHGKALSANNRASLHDERKIALVMCGLLSAFEFQQNNFRGGLQLLRVIFGLVAPLLTAGYNRDAMPGDDILDTILPVCMRNAGLLFTAWDGLDAEILPRESNDDLETATFRGLCTTYALLKDTYLAYKSEIATSIDRLLIKQGEVRAHLHSHTKRATSLLAKGVTDPAQRCRINAILEYCDIGIGWLQLTAMAAASAYNCASFLTSVLDHLEWLSQTASHTYPAASQTRYFEVMTITPVAYFAAVFAPNAELRNQALRMIDYPALESPKTQLHAIVTSLEHKRQALPQPMASWDASKVDLTTGAAAKVDTVLFSRTQLLPAQRSWVKSQENFVFGRANIEGPHLRDIQATGPKTWIGGDINGAYQQQVHHFG